MTDEASREAPDVSLIEGARGDDYPSMLAMKYAVEMEIVNALGRVQTQTLGKIIQRAINDALTSHKPDAVDFQSRVASWMQECFGLEISGDIVERNHRFLEEALELVQARGCTRSEAHQLVDYTFDRPAGDPAQETGGVMVTLAALCLAAGIDMRRAGERELTRIWGKIEQIRAKQAAKPKHSPLPQADAADEEIARLRVALEQIVRILSHSFPYGGAHSWEAFSGAVYQAFRDINRIASAALDSPKSTEGE